MFMGMFQHNIDVKGRLNLPTQFREAINATPDGTLVLTRHLDRCLVLYPSLEWNNFKEKAKQLPSMDPEVRRFLRFLYSRAMPCTLDKQGRILVPPPLRDYAELNGETCLIGMDHKIEIWNVERWSEEDNLTTANPNEIQKAMAQLGM